MPAQRRVLLLIGACAGGIAAFPLGLYLGRPGPPRESPGVRQADGPTRDIFSPARRSDPQVLEGWRRTVVAMEAGCRASSARCAEARAARHRLGELQHGR